MNPGNDDRNNDSGFYARGGAYGFLYILTNQSMPGLVKVGQTERHPAARVLELSNHSGVPTPFFVKFFIEVNDRFKAEQAIHKALASCRVSVDREFFKANPDEVERLLCEAAKEFITPSAARMPSKNERAEQSIQKDHPVSVCTKCGGRTIRDAFNMYTKCTICGDIKPTGVNIPQPL